MYVCMYVYAPVNIYIYVNRLYSYEYYMSTYDTYAYTDVYIYIMYTCTLTSNKFNTLNKEPQSPSVCTDMTGDGCMSTSYLCIYVYIYIHIFITKFPRYACRSSKQLQLLRRLGFATIIECICSEQRELLSCQAGPASSATSSPPSTNLASVSRELFPPVADAAPETIPAAC